MFSANKHKYAVSLQKKNYIMLIPSGGLSALVAFQRLAASPDIIGIPLYPPRTYVPSRCAVLKRGSHGRP